MGSNPTIGTMGYLDGIKLRLQRQRDMTLKRPGFVTHLNCYRPWASEPNTKTGYTLYGKPTAIDDFDSRQKDHDAGVLCGANPDIIGSRTESIPDAECPNCLCVLDEGLESGLLTIDSRGRILDMTQEVHYKLAPPTERWGFYGD